MIRTKTKINQEAADRAVFFMSRLKHSTGEYAGQPFTLEPWQEDIVRKLFGTLNPDGTRQYRTCYVTVGRKNGKTELGAGIALYLLFADNEPGAQIYSAAADRQQAGLLYHAATPMIRQAPALAKRATIVDSQKRVIVPATNSYYQVLSAEAYSKDGLNAHGIFFDELHAQPNRDLWDVLTTSVGSRRQPLVFAMTTAGYDRNSICYEQHDYACKVRDGIVDDPTFLPVIFEVPEKADWTEEDNWKLANPALGSFRNMDEMRQLCRKAQETPALEMTFRRLYLNQWVNSAVRWLPIEKWDATAGTVDTEELRGHPCYAGLDLSATTDLTALSLVFPWEETYKVLVHYWIPEATMREKERKDRVPYALWVKQGYITATEGNVIDYKAILVKLEEYRALYDIQEVAFDRWGATKLSQDLTDAGFTMVPFGQGFVSMSPPTKELMNLVLSKKIHHGGNPVLRWNVDNLVVNQDPAGNLKPDKAKSTQRIDGAVAMIMALDRATRHAGSGKSVYEGRGVLFL